MNVFATIEILPNTTTRNGRKARQALVDLTTADGQWAGSFLVFGLTTQELKDRAYMEAGLNASSKGYTLQSLREAA